MAENETKTLELDPKITSEDSPKKENINIFDEFSTDNSLEEEVNSLKKKSKKDIYYYFQIYGKVIQTLFFLIFIWIIILWVYVYIQKSDNMVNVSYLNQVCGFFKADVPNPEANCSSISYSHKHYENKLQTLEKDISSNILWVLPVVYESENFLKSKEIAFLVDKSETKLDIIKVLEDFNNLKKDFTWLDRRKLVCGNFKINSIESTLSVSCSSYSKWYEWNIIWFSWEKSLDEVKWTSISIANSFLNYIEKKSENFSLIEKTKIFSNKEVLLDSWYTSQTTFKFKLKINKLKLWKEQKDNKML